MKITWSSFHENYTEDVVRRYVSTGGGVYLLWVKLKTGKWRCFYTGRASNLESRLLAHLSSKEPDTCIKTNIAKYICGFEYAKLKTQSDRKGIEKFLYDQYKPECNDLDPGGTAITVNLP